MTANDPKRLSTTQTDRVVGIENSSEMFENVRKSEMKGTALTVLPLSMLVS